MPVQLRVAGLTVNATGYIVADPLHTGPLIDAYLARFPHARAAAVTAMVIRVDVAQDARRPA